MLLKSIKHFCNADKCTSQMNPFLFLREWWNLLTVRAIMCFAISFEPGIKVFKDSSWRNFIYLQLLWLACLGYLTLWGQTHPHHELALPSLKVATNLICVRKTKVLANKTIQTILPLVPFWMSEEAAKQVKYFNRHKYSMDSRKRSREDIKFIK